MRAWIRVFFRQWLYELIRWPSFHESFYGTCFRCMHYKSQHIVDEFGNVECSAEGGCNCQYKLRAASLNGKEEKE